jgi:hypothetical protein
MVARVGGGDAPVDTEHVARALVGLADGADTASEKTFRRTGRG